MSSLNVAALSSVDIQKIKKEELTDIRSIKLDPSVPQDLRAVYVLKEMGCPFRFLSAQKERPITSHPIFWTLCPEAEASLMGPLNRVTI